MTAERDQGLEMTRAIAIMVVVATHAALSFMVTPIGWTVQDQSRHLGVDLAVWIARAFVMPTFFWLSGYFGRAVFDTRGVRGFVRHRVTRIVLPFAIVLVPCSLGVDALWAWGGHVVARAEVADNVPKLGHSELPLRLGHLWYLYYLLWFSAAAALATLAVRRACLVLARNALAILAIPAALTFGVLVEAGAVHVDTPISFLPDLRIAIYMGAYFGWGWLVRARPLQLTIYRDRAWHAIAIAPVLLAVVIVTLVRGLDDALEAPIYASAASALFSIALVVALVGASLRYATRPHRVVGLVARSSYAVYIVHLPLVVALQIAVAESAVPGVVKYVGIVAVTTLACVGGYALVTAEVAATKRRAAS